MDVPNWKPAPRHVLNLQGDTVTSSAQGSSNTETSVPLAAQNHEGGRITVPLPDDNDTIPAESHEQDETLSDESKDSFDWIGDDRRDQDSEYEDAMIEEISAPGAGPPGRGAPAKSEWTNFFNALLFFVFALCVTIWLLKLTSIQFPTFASVSFHLWITLVFLFVFVPVWSQTAIQKFTRAMKSTPAFSKSDLPSKIDGISGSLAICVSSLLIGIFWICYFPRQCMPNLTQADLGEYLDDLDGFDPFNYEVQFCIFEYLPRIFVFVFVSALFMSMGSFFMSSLKSSFQEKSFKSRLVENRYNIHIVDMLLLAAKRQQITRHTTSTNTAADIATSRTAEIRESTWDFMFNLPFVIPEQLFAWWRKNRQPSTYTRLATDHPHHLSTAEFSEFRAEIIRTIHTAGYETIASTPPRTDHDAKILARKIFHYLCPADRKHLILDDFTDIMLNETASSDAYNVFDFDRDGVITKNEFRGAIVRIFREQRNLLASIANTGSVLSILDTMNKWVTVAGLFLFLLALFGVKVSNLLGVTASIVLALNFIIFDAANKTFHSLLFLFVMHPYDVGDRIVMGREVGYSDEDALTVMHINIQNTVFRRWNGLFVSVPNHVLAAGPLTNLSRGNEQWERVEFTLFAPDQHKLTMEEETARLADLRKRIEKFLHHYSQDYYQSFELRAVIAADTGKSDRNLDTLKFFLKIRCRQTADSQKKWIRHSRILAFVKQAVCHSGVEFASA